MWQPSGLWTEASPPWVTESRPGLLLIDRRIRLKPDELC
jgi:hypothetical protein